MLVPSMDSVHWTVQVKIINELSPLDYSMYTVYMLEPSIYKSQSASVLNKKIILNFIIGLTLFSVVDLIYL